MKSAWDKFVVTVMILKKSLQFKLMVCLFGVRFRGGIMKEETRMQKIVSMLRKADHQSKEK